MGIGFGTVHLYCSRVVWALRHFGLDWVCWSDRSTTKAWVYARTCLARCIGMLDGTLIQMTEPPRGSGSIYFCRKKFPAINVQAVVDHLRRFINVDLGWPGNVTDVSLWTKSFIWEHRHEFFGPGEYVLADKGYPSSPFVLRPFTEPEVAHATPERHRRMRMFNRLVSSIRLFGTPVDVEDMYRAVEALMSVHNFCIDEGDHPEDIPWYDWSDPDVQEAVAMARQDMGDDEDIDAEGQEEVAAYRQLGQEMREQFFEALFPPE
ncbi:hypothetical protein EVJ58_g8606 [Rhodofomes roseus]|uniref:DDE Tnp4 domain-containing protein n=1 Tax=Rhodofomes roseus TaxID=34475 RepID=A0A4Y9XXI9_9APHY|nr:hypothetical protein EVJ58_g8606 [Rhodofomes roseus]